MLCRSLFVLLYASVSPHTQNRYTRCIWSIAEMKVQSVNSKACTLEVDKVPFKTIYRVKIVACSFVLFPLDICSVFLRNTDYDYPFGIIKFFLELFFHLESHLGYIRVPFFSIHIYFHLYLLPKFWIIWLCNLSTLSVSRINFIMLRVTDH
jgi:hypothetical protein